MGHMNLDEAEDKFDIPKRGSLKPKKTYLTKGYGYEEDYDLVLEGKQCHCGGTLQYHRRHERDGTRTSSMMGGTGQHTEFIHKRVETVLCDTCNSSHDIGIYHVWSGEQNLRNPAEFLL